MAMFRSHRIVANLAAIAMRDAVVCVSLATCPRIQYLFAIPVAAAAGSLRMAFSCSAIISIESIQCFLRHVVFNVRLLRIHEPELTP